MSRPWDATAKECQSKGMSKPHHRKAMSHQRDVTAKGCQSLARKLRFHIFNFQSLREVSHESFVFTSSTFRFWGKSRTKAYESFVFTSSTFNSLTEISRESHIFRFQILKKFRAKAYESFRAKAYESFIFTSSTFTGCEGGLARNSFLKGTGCTNYCLLQDKTCPGRWMGKVCRAIVSERSRLSSDHSRIGPAVELPVQAWFSHVEVLNFEGGPALARKLRFHIFNVQFLRDVLHESFHVQILRGVSNETFVFTSSTFNAFRFWVKSRTKAYESFVFTSSTCRFWGKSRTKAYKSFVFTPSTFRFWGMSRTKPSLSFLPFRFLRETPHESIRKLRFQIFHLQILREISHESIHKLRLKALRAPNTKAPGVRFSFNAPPAHGRGLWIGIFSRKFRESYAKERAKVKVHIEGGGSINLAKKKPGQQQSALRRDSVMLAACLKGYQEVTCDSLA